MKHVYPLYREKKIGKSKIDINFQFLFMNWKLNGRMTHGRWDPKTKTPLKITYKYLETGISTLDV